MDREDRERLRQEDKEFFKKVKAVGLFMLYFAGSVVVGLLVIIGLDIVEHGTKWVIIGSAITAYELAFGKKQVVGFKKLFPNKEINSQSTNIYSKVSFRERLARWSSTWGARRIKRTNRGETGPTMPDASSRRPISPVVVVVSVILVLGVIGVSVWWFSVRPAQIRRDCAEEAYTSPNGSRTYSDYANKKYTACLRLKL
jgi:hypothetical protein